jgi:hypothetical protein
MFYSACFEIFIFLLNCSTLKNCPIGKFHYSYLVYILIVIRVVKSRFECKIPFMEMNK